MITYFDKPIKTKNSDIDEKYHGKYIAFLDTSELFGEGFCYVAAMGEKTDEVFDELLRYIRILRKKRGMRGNVCSGDKYRDDGGNIYVEIRNIR